MKENISIDQSLFTVYPDIRLGILRFQTEVKDPDPVFWSHMDSDILPGVRSFLEGKQWNEIPGVRGSRQAYRAFGRNPGRYRVSSEALLRRVRRGDSLYRINSVVDVNNEISVISGLSVGSYDLDRIGENIVLRKAGKGEGYQGIGKDFLDMENMLVLADGEGIFGSSLSDSTRAMVTKETKNILTVIYCFEKDTDLDALLKKAAESFVRYAGARNMESLSV